MFRARQKCLYTYIRADDSLNNEYKRKDNYCRLRKPSQDPAR